MAELAVAQQRPMARTLSDIENSRDADQDHHHSDRKPISVIKSESQNRQVLDLSLLNTPHSLLPLVVVTVLPESLKRQTRHLSERSPTNFLLAIVWNCFSRPFKPLSLSR